MEAEQQGQDFTQAQRERYSAKMLSFYDKQGNCISDEEFARLHADPTYRQVARDRVKDWLISTVWLGLDHRFTSSIPIIFETMVFPPESSYDEYCERYATEAGALAGHQEALMWLLDKLGPEAVDYVDYEEKGIA